MSRIENQSYDYERALYLLEDSEVVGCHFGNSDVAESALKETRSIQVKSCQFDLRYPLWHCDDSIIEDSTFTEKSRAAFWYDSKLVLKNLKMNGVKALRECKDIRIEDCEANSTEFGWRNDGLVIENLKLTSEYPFFMSKNVKISHLEMKGKYSFQYNENLMVSDSILDTKDAFWHTKDVVIENCDIKGEYIGWYSENLTLRNCRISGTQPFCYCKGLRLENCELIDADLAFEYSDCNVQLKGHVVSIKNPKSGIITCDSLGELILKDHRYAPECKVVVGGKTFSL